MPITPKEQQAKNRFKAKPINNRNRMRTVNTDDFLPVFVFERIFQLMRVPVDVIYDLMQNLMRL